MSKSEFRQIINASKEKTWDVLFKQYGDIHIHNPGMPTSKYLGNSTQGELNCSRHVTFNDKLFLEETITEVNGTNSFKVEAYKHNLPMMKSMSATYELKEISENKTEVIMTSDATSSPGLMMFLMKGQLGKGLKMHLFGMKYYIETGKIVTKDNYKELINQYK